jgi:carbonic anhydrase
MLTAEEALERLKEGNRRFVSGLRNTDEKVNHSRRIEISVEQSPIAIILGCSDSRVPAEYVFDQGLGDLFVIRVAGNVVASSQIASVEFAAAKFGTRLVVVLGHSQCGVILETLDQIQQPIESQSRHLHAIVERVRPSVEKLLKSELSGNRDRLIERAVTENVIRSMHQLRHGSEIIEKRICDDGLLVVGAEYSLETGEVEFLKED